MKQWTSGNEGQRFRRDRKTNVLSPVSVPATASADFGGCDGGEGDQAELVWLPELRRLFLEREIIQGIEENIKNLLLTSLKSPENLMHP